MASRSRRVTSARRRTAWYAIEPTQTGNMLNNTVVSLRLADSLTGGQIDPGSTILATRIHLSANVSWSTGSLTAMDLHAQAGLVVGSTLVANNTYDPNTPSDDWMGIVYADATMRTGTFWLERHVMDLNFKTRRKFREDESLWLSVRQFISATGTTSNVVNWGIHGRILLALP